MKRKQCLKDEKGDVHMSQSNLLLCLRNQQAYENKQLNESLHLQYYGFCDIDNLAPFKSLHTIFLNNNAIEVIQNLQGLTSLCTINLSYNRIKSFSGLAHLTNLHTIDLTSNMIQYIPEEEIAPLTRLSQLKLGFNKLSSYESIKAVVSLAKSLTYLDLNSNQDFQFDPRFFEELLQQMTLISVLSLQQTAFNRSVSSYRKETINAGSAILFLDDRQVTEDERSLARAWKQGGLVLEKEVRQNIREKLVDKQSKIYCEMEQRSRIADQKRRRAYDKLTYREQTQLNTLLEKVQSEEFEIEQQEQKNKIHLKIQDLQRFLQLMRVDVQNIDVDKVLADGKIELPKMIIDKQTPTAIYVYNVDQQQLPIIKEKYYPNEERELIAVNYTKQTELRWIKQYDALLLDCYNQLKGNMDLLVPTFNLSLYDFDQNSSRKVKRFELQQLKEHWKQISAEQQQRQRSLEVLYELD